MTCRHLRFLSMRPSAVPALGLVSLLPLALYAWQVHAETGRGRQVGQRERLHILVSPEREVDILFMIDNSPSMDPKQQRLADNFSKMIQALLQIPDGSGVVPSLPDVHIGVYQQQHMGRAGFGWIGAKPRVFWTRTGDLLYGNESQPILFASVATRC